MAGDGCVKWLAIIDELGGREGTLQILDGFPEEERRSAAYEFLRLRGAESRQIG